MCSMEPILAEDQCPYRAPLCVENLELPSGGFSYRFMIHEYDAWIFAMLSLEKIQAEWSESSVSWQTCRSLCKTC